MRRQLSVALLVALTATVAGTAAGCGGITHRLSGSPVPTVRPANAAVTTPATPADRSAALANATAALRTWSAHLSALIITPTTYLTVRTDFDPITKTTHVTIAGNQSMEIISIGSDAYVRSAGLSKKPWLHVNLAKLPKSSTLRSTATVTDSLAILGGVVRVSDAGFQHFNGTTNLHKAAANAPNGAMRGSLEALAALIGPSAATVPFSVSVDDLGRLRSIGFDVTTAQGEAVTTELHVWEYGKSVKVTVPPPAEVEEATAAQYKRL